MSPVIIDLTAQRGGSALLEPLLHPAGVKLPFESPSDAALIIPEIRSEIRAGTYSADMIGLLDDAVRPGDRVLVIGAGLGVVSTLVAKRSDVKRVIAVEANTTLIPYLKRVHDLNGTPAVETVNAVLAEDKKGRVPFFARRDLRMSSLLPHDRSWQQVMMVPFMDLNLILAEEQISLIICDIPVDAAQLVARAELESVERVLVNCTDEPAACWEEDGACALLIKRGFLPEPTGGAVLFQRASSVLTRTGAPDGDAADVEAEDRAPRSDKPIDDDLKDDGLIGEDPGDEDTGDDEDFGDEVSEDDHAARDVAEEASAPGGEPAPVGKRPPRDVTDRKVEEDALDDVLDFTPILDPGPSQQPEGVATGPRSQGIETEWETEARRAEESGFAAGDHFASLFKSTPAEDGDRQRTRFQQLQTEQLSLPDQDPDFGRPERSGATPGADHGPTAPEPPRADEPRPEATSSAGFAGNGSRLWAIAGLALALALPLMAIGEFAGSRAERKAAATGETVVVWGGPQTLTGPFLMVPVEGPAGLSTPPLVVLPDRLQVTSRLDTALQREATFPVPAYEGHHQISIDFDPGFLDGDRVAALLADGETLQWDRAMLGLGITQPKALTGAPVLSLGDGQARFEPGTGPAGMPGIVATTGDPRENPRGWSITLDLDGSAALRLTPAGRITEARIDAAWSAPGIGATPSGEFRPGTEQTGAGGLAARWSVPQLAHSLPQAFRGTAVLGALDAVAFGVALDADADLYQGAQRAAKFGFLLIVLSFVLLVAIERATGRRPHLVQYALIGAAQCLFYLLMVPLAEVIGLPAGFAVTAAATVTLLTVYAWAGMALGPRSLWLAGALSALYAAMYLVLSGAGYLMLTGAVMAFALLAAAMWLTRGRAEPDPAQS